MSCWTVLRITPTRNIDKINEAYVELSNSISENNKDAEELELAYNKAISLATASIGDLNIALLNNSNFDILSALINSSIDDTAIDKYNNSLGIQYGINNPNLSKQELLKLLFNDWQNNVDKRRTDIGI